MDLSNVQEHAGTYKTTQSRTRQNSTIQNHTASYMITQDHIGPEKGQPRQFMTIERCTGSIQDPEGLNRTVVDSTSQYGTVLNSTRQYRFYTRPCKSIQDQT